MDILSLMSFIVYILLVPSLQAFMATDTISHSQSLSDGNGMSLLSKNGNFELGFFSPGNSKKRYLGIWYKNIPIQTVVWVANRLHPINDSSGILTINSTGNLILSQNGSVVWNTNPLKKPQISNPVVLPLLDSSNLVVREEKETNPENYVWHSFDYPTDTLLPGMKFGCDLRTGLNRGLTAWKSPDDPSPGDFSLVTVLNRYPDCYMMKGSEKFYREGPWNDLRSSGSPEAKPNPVYDYKYVSNKDEVYYMYTLRNDSVISRLVINQTEYVRHLYVWGETDRVCRIYTTVPRDYCDNYALCGAYGNCMITESPVCQCLKGFKPMSPQQWNSMDWSQGCVREKPLNCKDKQKDGFVKLVGLKVPDTTYTWLDETMSLDECRDDCLNSCSCMAYTNSDIRGQGSGCVMWFGDLVDIRQFPVGGQDLYLRMDASEVMVGFRHKKQLAIIVATTAAVIFGTLLVGCFYLQKVRRKKIGKNNVYITTRKELNGDDALYR